MQGECPSGERIIPSASGQLGLKSFGSMGADEQATGDQEAVLST